VTASLFVLSFFSRFNIAPLSSWEPLALYTDFAPALTRVMHVALAVPPYVYAGCTGSATLRQPDAVVEILQAARWRATAANLKMRTQELMWSVRTRADVLDLVSPKPFPRILSYDPEAGDSPTRSAAFVKGERQFTLSGFKFDGDETGRCVSNAKRTPTPTACVGVACASLSVLVAKRSWIMRAIRRQLIRQARMRRKHGMCPTSLYRTFLRMGGGGCCLLKSFRPTMTA
jgi:hypothetical protein